jgi:tetratricopeptide (TPR) repeat protein
MSLTVLTSAKLQDPGIQGVYWLSLGQDYLDAGKFADALDALQRAAVAAPLNIDVYRLQAVVLHANGRQSEALAAGLAVLALEGGSALALFNIGTAYFMNRHWEPAAGWYRLALLLDPDLVPANQNLAAILQQEGRTAEADRHYDRAYRRQSLFIEPAASPVRNILILCSSRPGNVPFDDLLPQTCNQRIKWVIEYAAEGEPQPLPHYDVVFNAIGDADTARRSQAAVDRFLALNDKPLLNRPECIARTSRDRIGSMLEGIEGLEVPRVIRWDPCRAGAMDVHARIAAAGLAYPIIARPVGAHGGDGVVLLQTPQALAAISAAAAGELYLSSYREYRSDDGYFRKYRVIFVDRRPYPYHLAIGSNWLTHYVTADMLSTQWKIGEEYRFLDNPAGVLGAAAWAALEAVAQRLDLDFCGVDFSLLADGRLLVFEANATMLVHLEEYHEMLKFKNWYVHRILNAFDRLLDRRMGLGTDL